jgi:hypothetical protein
MIGMTTTPTCPAWTPPVPAPSTAPPAWCQRSSSSTQTSSRKEEKEEETEPREIRRTRAAGTMEKEEENGNVTYFTCRERQEALLSEIRTFEAPCKHVAPSR